MLISVLKTSVITGTVLCIFQNEDWTDYMQDLAGEYTTCDIVPNNQLGAWTLPGIVTPVGQQPVGMLMDYVEGMGLTRQERDKYAKEIFTKWIAQNPYMRQVKKGS